MKIRIMLILVLSVGFCFAQQKIIPVNKWPKVIYTENKQIYNPTPSQCVEAGYRLKPASKPATPDGKIILNQKLVQDENNSERLRYDIQYIDRPFPSPALSLILTNVPAERVQFIFTTNGFLHDIEWLDAPKTNNITSQK